MNDRKFSPTIFIVLLILLVCFLGACSPKDPYRFSQPGKHQFGTKLEYSFVDASRADRPVNITVWYPAVLPKDAPYSDNNYDAQSDLSGAPYPVILSSAKVGSIFGPHLATYGFVVVGVKGQDSSSLWGKWLVDYPLDIVFALNQVAFQPLKGLEGMLDTDHVGAMGYSFDSFSSLSLGGARIDPQYYQDQCASVASMNPAPPEWWVEYICNITGWWDKFVANAGPSLTTSSDGLWQPITDKRILVVMPMAPEGAWMFGKRGLAAVDRPVLLIGALEDEYNFYDREAAVIFKQLGSPDKSMITFVNESHMMIESKDPVARMKHFAVAFFGYHLQGQKDYANYFSEKFVSKLEGMAWGVYQGK